MGTADAGTFYGAYVTVLSVVTAYHTLSLQALMNRVASLRNQQAAASSMGMPGAGTSARTSQLLFASCEIVVLVSANLVVFGAVALLADELARSTPGIPTAAMTLPIFLLSGLVAAVTIFYLAAIGALYRDAH